MQENLWAAELITSFKQVAVDQTSSQRRSFDPAEMIEEVIRTLSPTFKKSRSHAENLIPRESSSTATPDHRGTSLSI